MRAQRVLITLITSALAVAMNGSSPAGETREFILSPEGNHLWAYDAETGGSQLVIRAQNGGDPGAEPPAGSHRRDINGQICVSPDGSHVITGEDTVIPNGGGGSSHDPRIAGWGYFEISGDELGEITATQVGKLAPEAGEGPGYTGDPDNFGCGFLDDDRLVTTAIGNTLPGEPANGQLFIWFGPFDAGFRQETPEEGAAFFVGEVPHCVIDDTLATAGGVTISDDGDVYVATNRPDDQGNAGSVWRYSGDFPTSFEECDGADVTKEQVVPSVPGLPGDPRSPTPSAVALSPAGTLYVSSVFSGTVAEYSTDGLWLRDIYPLSPVTPPQGPLGNTPFGLTVTADGTLWIADLGIVLSGPVSGQGSVIKVTFDALGQPTPFGETIADGLTFPDGLGLYTVDAA